MKRRTVIATAVTAFSGGCLGTVNDIQSMSGENKRAANVKQVDSTTSEIPIVAELETVASQFTKDHPAKVHIRFRNESEETVEMEFGPTPPFSTRRSKQDGAVLLFPEGHNYSQKGPDVWTPDVEEGGLIVQNDVLKEVRMSPGTSVEGTYELWDAPNDSDYLSRGEYRFEESFGIRYDEREQRFDWGFTIEIE